MSDLKDTPFSTMQSKIRLVDATILVQCQRQRKFWRDTNEIRVEITLLGETKSGAEVSYATETIWCFDSVIDTLLSQVRDIASNSNNARVMTASKNESLARIAMYRYMDLEATPVGVLIRWLDHKGNLIGSTETEKEDKAFSKVVEQTLDTNQKFKTED